MPQARGVSFQSGATRQGHAFEQQAKEYLKALGFVLHGRKKFSFGCEIDEVAEAPNGELVYFEFKGSFQGSRPGMQRTDTAKKALVTGFFLRAEGDDTPYYVITSHLPTRGAALQMVNAARAAKAVSDVLQLNEPATTAALGARFGRPAKRRLGPKRTWQQTLPAVRDA